MLWAPGGSNGPADVQVIVIDGSIVSVFMDKMRLFPHTMDEV
jgi:hypothetical protein